MAVGTVVALLPAAVPAPRTMPGTYKRRRRAPSRAGLRMSGVLSSWAELMVQPAMLTQDRNVRGWGWYPAADEMRAALA